MASLLIIILGYILFLILCGGIIFWLIAKPFRIGVRLFKSIGVVAVATWVGLAVSLAVLWFLSRSQKVQGLTTGMLALTGVFVISLFPSVVVVLRLTRTTIPKAIATYAIVLVSQFGVSLTIRATLSEAFVVPSGSMAMAVIGQHGSTICDNCNRDVVFGVTPDPFSAQDHATCINCLAQTSIPKATKPAEGDRVLTLKTRQPRRWEIAAFKAPHRLDTTYLGRIVGLPGETIEIVSGDLFVNGQREVRPADRFSAMWLLVNDTAFTPQISDKDNPGWRPKSPDGNWKFDQGKWTIRATDMQELIFDREINLDMEFSLSMPQKPLGAVRDVRIDMEIDSLTGAGDLQIVWRHRDVTVTASFSQSGESSMTTGEQVIKIPVSGGVFALGARVGLAVRDGVASLLVHEKVMATLIIESQKNEDHQPANPSRSHREEEVFCELAVHAQNVETTIRRLVVRRDVHYIGTGESFAGGCQGCTGNPIKLGADEYFSLGDNSPFSNDGRHWSEIDPSLQGRYQVGALPGELMVGVAHWIYWPLHRAGAIND